MDFVVCYPNGPPAMGTKEEATMANHVCDWVPRTASGGGLLLYLECACCQAQRQPTTAEVRCSNVSYWQGVAAERRRVVGGRHATV
jgi:hypothetical protein